MIELVMCEMMNHGRCVLLKTLTGIYVHYVNCVYIYIFKFKSIHILLIPKIHNVEAWTIIRKSYSYPLVN